MRQERERSKHIKIFLELRKMSLCCFNTETLVSALAVYQTPETMDTKTLEFPQEIVKPYWRA